MKRIGLTLVAATIATALFAVGDAQAARIGARIYLQPWTPQNPDQDLQTVYKNETVISDDIDEAWGEASAQMTSDLPQMLAEHDIGGGFRTYDVKVTLNPVQDYTLTPFQRGNGGTLQFTIPNFHIEMSIRTPKFTLLRREDDPRFSVDADLVVSVAIGVSPSGPKILSAGNVNAVLRNLRGPDALNGTARALNDAAAVPKALLSFLTGSDFDSIVEAVINQQNIAQSRLQPLIDAKFDQINNEFATIPGAALLPRKMWADHNRITLYAAPPAIPDYLVPRDGTLGGAITWDSTRVSGSCGSVRIDGIVETGPPVLLESDGVTFSPAPTLAVGTYTLDQAGDDWRARMGPAQAGPQSCSYKLLYVPRGWPIRLHATANFVSQNGSGSSDPYVNLHHAANIEPDGWSGDAATADADSVNYAIVDEMEGGARVGKLRDARPPVDAGEQQDNPGNVERGALQTHTQIQTQTPTQTQTQTQSQTPWAARRRNPRANLPASAAGAQQQGEGQ